MITATEALNRLIDQNELFYDEMTDLMRQIMTGQLQPEIIAALLIGLRIKVETVSEIAAAATVMRDFATKVPVLNKHQLVDIVALAATKRKPSTSPPRQCLWPQVRAHASPNTAAVPCLRPAAPPTSWSTWVWR